MPSVGAALAVTLTLKLPPVLKLPSLTLKPTELAPTLAEQLAERLALTVPAALTRLLTVKPAGTLGAVTVRLPGLDCASEIVAIMLLLAAEPCWRVTPAVGVRVGAVFELIVTVPDT